MFCVHTVIEECSLVSLEYIVNLLHSLIVACLLSPGVILLVTNTKPVGISKRNFDRKR